MTSFPPHPFRAVEVRHAPTLHGSAWIVAPVIVLEIVATRDGSQVAKVEVSTGAFQIVREVPLSDLARTPREAGELLARKLSQAAADEKSASIKKAGDAAA